jgi:hypothetical protein
MRSARLVVGGVLAVATMGGFTLYLLRTELRAATVHAQGDSGEAAAKWQQLSAELANAREDVATLKQTQLAMAAKQSALLEGAGDAADTPTQQASTGEVMPADERDDEEALNARIAEERVGTAARYATLANELADEPRDQAWASATETGIRAKLVSMSTPEGSITSVECGSTLCRAEVAFSSIVDAHAFRPPIVEGITRGTLHISEEEGKQPRVTVYLARGDRSLHPLNRGGTPLDQTSNR